MLVIACNTASCGDAARRARALRRARRRGDPARRAPSGRAPRRPAGSASSAPRAPSARAPTTTRSPRRRTSSSSRRRARDSSSSSRRASRRGDELLAIAEEYLAPLKAADVDTLVLGCTHYPFLKGAISYVMGEAVTPRLERRRDRERRLPRARLDTGSSAARRRRPPTATRRPATRRARFLDLAHRLIAPEIPSVELVHTGAVTIPDREQLRQESDTA